MPVGRILQISISNRIMWIESLTFSALPGILVAKTRHCSEHGVSGSLRRGYHGHARMNIGRLCAFDDELQL